MLNYAVFMKRQTYDASVMAAIPGHNFIDMADDPPPASWSSMTVPSGPWGWGTPAPCSAGPAPRIRLSTVFLPHAASRRVVLFHHGNAETLRSCLPFLQEVHRELQCSVFALDYPGYGASGGAPTEASVLAAARAAYDHVTGTLKFAPADVVLVGWSLGSARGGPRCDRGAGRLGAGAAVAIPQLRVGDARAQRGHPRHVRQRSKSGAGAVPAARHPHPGPRCALLARGGARGLSPRPSAATQTRVTNFVEAKYGHDVKQWSGLYVAVGDFLNNTETRN